jgi:hypothetical protein
MATDNKIRDELIALVGVALAFIAFLVTTGQQQVLQKIKADLKDIWFWVFLVIVIVFSWWGVNQTDDPAMILGVHHGLTALIASYFSHLSLIFPAYFFAAIVAYFSMRRFI